VNSRTSGDSQDKTNKHHTLRINKSYRRKIKKKKKSLRSQMWWHKSVIPAILWAEAGG
jgi:hypothetical protein